MTKDFWKTERNRAALALALERRSMIVRCALLFCILLNVVLLPVTTQAQAPAESYRIDYPRYFFPSREAERSARESLVQKIKMLEGLRGRVGESADHLLKALRLADEVSQLHRKHDAYLYLQYADNTDDTTSLSDEEHLSASVSEQTAFLTREIQQISTSRLAAFEKQQPLLRSYAFKLESVRKVRAHTRSLGEERLLEQLRPEVADWQSELYDDLRDQQESTGSASTDLHQAFVERDAALARNAALYSFTLTHLVAARNQWAVLHSYPDAAAESYASRFLSKEDVQHLLRQVADSSDVYKQYEQLRAEHIKSQLGVAEVGVWNEAPDNSPLGKMSLSQTHDVLDQALAPLGEQYLHQLDSLLDPANGRLDIGGEGHRKRGGGFSEGFIGFPSVFFAGQFTGSYNSMRVLAHESTHAVHREFMNQAHVLPPYAQGPNFVFESFAAFSELLLADYLYEHEPTAAGKEFYLEQFLDGKGTEAFDTAPEAELEQSIYEQAKDGLSVDKLDKLTMQVYSKYSIWPARTPEMRHRWMQIRLLYEDSFYDLNYVYASVLALKYYEMCKQNPQEFQRKYVALLKNGFDAPPDALLKKFLGIDLHDDRLFHDGLGVLKPKIAALEALYAEDKTQKRQ
jgi:oligoendopeptidase F